jgi:hypothetical protein
VTRATDSTHAPTTPPPDSGGRRRLVLGLVGLAIGLRLALALFTLGTNDVQGWQSFAQRSRELGIGELYRADRSLNHPPPMLLMARVALELAEATGVRFNAWLCLPAIAGDLLAIVLLGALWRRRGRPRLAWLAMLALAWSPCNALISGYHGNTDPLCAALVLLAAWVWDSERPAWQAGLAFAAAVNVKIIPLICLPALLADADRARLKGFAAGAAVGVLPFALGLLVTGPAFLGNVFGYGSQVDRWGVPGLLLHLARGEEEGLAWVAAYAPWGKALIVGGCLAWAAWAWRARRHDACARVTGCFLVFLAFAPGFGVQYAAYLGPLLLAVDVRLGVAYAALAGALVARVYWSFLVPGPYYATVVTAMWGPWAAFLAFLTWGLVLTALYRLPRLSGPPAPARP